jgi:hypothetical protein
LADLAAGAHTLVARAVDRVGNAARATRTFTVAGTGPAPLPSLRITDARRREGDAGRHAAVLTITLSRAAAGRVEVRYATRDATARAGSDYVARKGTLTIAPRTRAATVAVPVRGDRRRERDEALTVRLSRPRDARIADGSGRVTIVDDD